MQTFDNVVREGDRPDSMGRDPLAFALGAAGVRPGDDRLHRSLIDAMPMAVYTTDPQGRLLQYNRAAAALWGREPVIGEASWCGAWRLYRPDGSPLPHEQCPMEVAIRTGVPARGVEAAVMRPDGVLTPILAFPTPLFDESGCLTGAVNVLVDITERRAAQERDRANMERIGLALGAAGAGTWEIDIEAGSCRLSAESARLHGRPPCATSMPSDEWLLHVHPDHLDEARAALKHAIRTGAPYDCTLLTVGKDGVERWLHGLGRVEQGPDGRARSMLGIMFDATERKRAEAELAASAARLDRKRKELEAIYQEAPIGMALVARDGRFVRINDALAALIGGTAADMIGRELGEIAPRIRDRLAPLLKDLFASGEPLTGVEIAGALPGCPERIRHCVASFHPLRDSGGEVAAVSCLVQDVTERKAAENRLRASEAQLRAIVEATPECIKITDADGRLVFMNPAGLAMIEAPPAGSPVGQPVAELLVAGHRDDWIAANARSLAGEPVALSFDIVTFAGTRRTVESHIVPLVGEDGAPCTLAVTRDVTERRRAAAELARAQADLLRVSRLTAMGALASTLAHELNQPLTAIANYLSGGRRLLEDGGPAAASQTIEIVGRAAAQALRAGEIIRRVRAFAADEQVAPGPEPLVPIVDAARELASSGPHAAVCWSVDVATELRILADRVQIEQVLVNLLRNAVEATEGRTERTVAVRAARRDAMVELRVEDDGPGLAPEFRERLFVAFRTTKPTGTGLGLPLCRTIVEAHGGRIWAEASAAGGAAFCIVLPAAD